MGLERTANQSLVLVSCCNTQRSVH